MIIVQGSFRVEPEARSRFLGARIDVISASHEEDGCLEYVLAPDPIDPGLVIISERWESMEHLERHLSLHASQPADESHEPLPPPLTAEITVYEVASSRRLR